MDSEIRETAKYDCKAQEAVIICNLNSNKLEDTKTFVAGTHQGLNN